jgi:peptidyl-tRNA hydrolase
MDDPWVMYYVVRKDVPLSLARAMTLAGAAAVRCVRTYRDTWKETFEQWSDRPRKVALRAEPSELKELAELDGVCEDDTLLCLPPRRRSEAEPLLKALNPYTDGPRPRDPDPREPEPPRLVYLIRNGVMKTTGKAIAQAGHAAVEAGERYPDWNGAGVVRVTDDEGWERVKAGDDPIVVRDGGHTQVEPGTETVIAFLESRP